jgi:uncharacterized membrane protein YhaH (DUF805 family)
MNYAWFLFGFKGRINRARYLVVQLALLTFWLILWHKFSFHFASQWEALHWVVAITMIWINAAITVKRLHDRDRSGLWAIAILIVNRLAYAYYGLFELLLVILAVALSLLQTWVVIELVFLMGTDGPNRFGPDPTLTAPDPSIESRPKPASVPDFLVCRAGPPPRRWRQNQQ